MGGVLGTLVFLVLVAFGLTLFRRHRKHRPRIRSELQDPAWRGAYPLQSLDEVSGHGEHEQKKYSAQGFMPAELSARSQNSPIELSGDGQSVREFAR